MGIGNTLFLYLLVWWLTLFTILPLGVVRNSDTDKGHDPGAPVNPMLREKLAVNSIVSAIIVAIIWILVYFHVINWDAWFRDAIK